MYEVKGAAEKENVTKTSCECRRKRNTFDKLSLNGLDTIIIMRSSLANCIVL